MIMIKTSVKIRFATNPKVSEQSDVLFWDNYEEKVRANIKAGKSGTYTVYLKHQMLRSEMDRCVLELCERISWDGHPPIPFGSIARRYVFSGESNCDEIVVEASYHFVV